MYDQTVPVRDRGTSSNSVPVHWGLRQYVASRGKAKVPHEVHFEPSRAGASPSRVNQPSMAGTRVLAGGIGIF